MFLTHFVRGLGFPLHPFVRGLMFYYGLDFHELAHNFILNITTFIVVCEAFLRIPPHFGLWLARRLICGDGEGVAIGVVLHHRATLR